MNRLADAEHGGLIYCLYLDPVFVFTHFVGIFYRVVSVWSAPRIDAPEKGGETSFGNTDIGSRGATALLRSAILQL
jgi:hypothetical protein